MATTEFKLTTEQEAQFKAMLNGAELLKEKKLSAEEKTKMREQFVDQLIAEAKAEEARLEAERIKLAKMHKQRMETMMPHDRVNKAG